MAIQTLKDQINEVIKDIPTTFGVAVKYLESGEELLINNDRTYQLASVFKIPVLITAMRQIDEGCFQLSDRMELKYAHKTSPSGILTFLQDGLQPTIEDLLMLMIIISDNVATDMVLEKVGGPKAVNQVMRTLGFPEKELNITHSVHDLFNDVFHSAEPLLKRRESILRMKELGIHLDGEVYRPGSTANVATPQALNRLNEMIFRGEAATRAGCDKAIDIMLHQQLNARLPALFPPADAGLEMAHKTGTFIGVRNDSGIMFIDDKVHATVTVFTQKAGLPTPEEIEKVDTVGEDARIDGAMAKIGQLVYLYARE